ncbi:recombinase family protein [Saccharothrix sp. BKS2]
MAWVGRTSTYDQQDPTLSLPRQLRASQLVLPEDALIVAHFYDIESGRKELAARGKSGAHEQFAIPIPRDGGIQDLLAEAERPDRRFDYVICESIDRIARRTYIGTEIEHRLERAGVRLLAADEPFQLTAGSGRKAKVATQLLTRRVKQGISEYYVVEMLEKAWDGFAVHTESGFNIGKPCYGYQAKRVPHPVPAKRAKGQKKTFLEPDPMRAPVVKRIFRWRLEERAGYQVIADRLNLDLTANPPPVPVDPDRAAGCWSASSVRHVLTNPKYTGYMVWNRRARKSANARLNPVIEWVWSPEPVHEALIDLDTFLRIQQIASHRFGSRSAHGPSRHPQTKRSYLLRTYLFCRLCGRRMYGKTRHGNAYYVCAPKKDYVPPGDHGSGTFFVREDALLDRLNSFLNDHVFGPYRRALLDADARSVDKSAQQDREERTKALRHAITDTDARIRRTLRNLELIDNPDPDLIRDINQRRVELRAQKQRLEAELAEAEDRVRQVPNPDLLDALPVAKFRVDELPGELARRMFESLRLEIHYNRDTNTATCKVTLAGQTAEAARQAADQALKRKKDQERIPGPTLDVPPERRRGVRPRVGRLAGEPRTRSPRYRSPRTRRRGLGDAVQVGGPHPAFPVGGAVAEHGGVPLAAGVLAAHARADHDRAVSLGLPGHGIGAGVLPDRETVVAHGVGARRESRHIRGRPGRRRRCGDPAPEGENTQHRAGDERGS